MVKDIRGKEIKIGDYVHTVISGVIRSRSMIEWDQIKDIKLHPKLYGLFEISFYNRKFTRTNEQVLKLEQ